MSFFGQSCPNYQQRNCENNAAIGENRGALHTNNYRDKLYFVLLKNGKEKHILKLVVSKL